LVLLQRLVALVVQRALHLEQHQHILAGKAVMLPQVVPPALVVRLVANAAMVVLVRLGRFWLTMAAQAAGAAVVAHPALMEARVGQK
jgi:hypothetical protein